MRVCFILRNFNVFVIPDEITPLGSIWSGTCITIVESALDPEVAEFARRLKLIETCAVKSLLALAKELDQVEAARIEGITKAQSTNVEDSAADNQPPALVSNGQVIVCVLNSL